MGWSGESFIKFWKYINGLLPAPKQPSLPRAAFWEEGPREDGGPNQHRPPGSQKGPSLWQ